MLIHYLPTEALSQSLNKIGRKIQFSSTEIAQRLQKFIWALSTESFSLNLINTHIVLQTSLPGEPCR